MAGLLRGSESRRWGPGGPNVSYQDCWGQVRPAGEAAGVRLARAGRGRMTPKAVRAWAGPAVQGGP